MDDLTKDPTFWLLMLIALVVTMVIGGAVWAIMILNKDDKNEKE